jgi:hypothetical protein
MTVFTCLDIVVKLGVFEKMKEQLSTSAEELGETVGVDAGVIGVAF